MEGDCIERRRNEKEGDKGDDQRSESFIIFRFRLRNIDSFLPESIWGQIVSKRKKHSLL